MYNNNKLIFDFKRLVNEIEQGNHFEEVILYYLWSYFDGDLKGGNLEPFKDYVLPISKIVLPRRESVKVLQKLIIQGCSPDITQTFRDKQYSEEIIAFSEMFDSNRMLMVNKVKEMDENDLLDLLNFGIDKSRLRMKDIYEYMNCVEPGLVSGVINHIDIIELDDHVVFIPN